MAQEVTHNRTSKRIGRPHSGKTKKERVLESYKRRRAAGLKTTTVWVPEADTQKVRDYAKSLREAAQ